MVTMRTLFLNPPLIDDPSGSAVARANANHPLDSHWLPTCLAQPAALIANSKILDAPADALSLYEVLRRARGFELCVIHASSLSFLREAKAADALKAQNPDMRIGLVGPHASRFPERALLASCAIDFVCRENFDFAIKEIAEGRPLESTSGLSYRRGSEVVRNDDRPPIQDLDSLPSIYDVVRRDLIVDHYRIRYLRHPHLSLAAGRGCAARCTLLLDTNKKSSAPAPNKSARSVIADARRGLELFPQTREFFIEDETFAFDLERAAEVARGLGQLGIAWSFPTLPSVPAESLRLFRENGLRLLVVDYASGNQHLLSSLRPSSSVDAAREFTRDCRDLEIPIHGTFTFGLPGESRDTIAESIKYARELDIESVQAAVALAHTPDAADDHSPGWYDKAVFIAPDAHPTSSKLAPAQLRAAAQRFYTKFYVRPTPMLRTLRQMLRGGADFRARCREIKELLSFIRRRAPKTGDAVPRPSRAVKETIPS